MLESFFGIPVWEREPERGPSSDMAVVRAVVILGAMFFSWW
jgi:hypothetical protein